jgi:hypothetical protein
MNPTRNGKAGSTGVNGDDWNAGLGDAGGLGDNGRSGLRV